MGDLMTVKQVASRWRVDKMTVYRAIWAGELAATDLSRPGSSRARLRVAPEAAEAFIASRNLKGRKAA
ncbi:helix-turn-helix domain-containing protein [Micromonospora craterilacus]|uniref:helix-turn-helix domain-containing protein n=1 Tax=Micromonospora craterilacus TaxID=1655439 RepID=UPI000DA86DEE|nr:helix-turn-helix domain-containing protein [Micromonospora craterilacus]